MRRNLIRRFRPAAVVLAMLCVLGAAAAGPAEARTGRGSKSSAVPRLIEPGEKVTPVNGSAVKFRWSPEGIPGDTHRYDDFRVFQGNQAFEPSMIHKAEVPPGQGWIEIPAEFVSKPGIYCWTVKRVGARDKTREAFSVFKVEAPR